MQVDEIYRFAPAAAAFSYFVALLTLGVLIDTGDMARGVVWFLWATAVTVFRLVTVVLYKRRAADSDPRLWGRLMIVGNVLAGLQWGVLGSLLFPTESGYRQIFIVMVVTCFIGGSVVAYAPLRGAHEALSIPAGVPLAITLFVVQGGMHWLAGVTGLFFCFTIVYYARKHSQHIEDSLRLQLERDELLSLTATLNEKLASENRELAHRAAVRGVSAENAREVADRLAALFEGSPLPQIECDAAGIIMTCNPAAERLFGERRETLAGRPLNSLLVGPQAAGKALAGVYKAMNVEIEIRARHGDAVHCTASFTPLPATQGRGAGFGLTLYGLPLVVA